MLFDVTAAIDFRVPVMPLAFFLTWTTYGTWLHGSSKGEGSVDASHHEYGTPFVPADPVREQVVRERMNQLPYVMSAPEREIVLMAIVGISRERGWTLLAAHVRFNHVHVVISADRDPSRLMSDLKGRASRELSAAGFDNNQRKRWTRHGSTKYLFTADSIHNSILYVIDEQGDRMSWFMKSGHDDEH